MIKGRSMTQCKILLWNGEVCDTVTYIASKCLVDVSRLADKTCNNYLQVNLKFYT